MTYQTLTTEQVIVIHDDVLNPGELDGMAKDKSLDGALARVRNRLDYGLIQDIFDLASAYAVAIATGHRFNDANKRTAFRSMDTVLRLNGIRLQYHDEDIGPLIIELAQRKLEGEDLADWLRARAD